MAVAQGTVGQRCKHRAWWVSGAKGAPRTRLAPDEQSRPPPAFGSSPPDACEPRSCHIAVAAADAGAARSAAQRKTPPPRAAATDRREKGSDTLLGGLVLEYDPAAGPTKFMVGTEQGLVLPCNRKAKNPADRVGASYGGHHGPVYGLRRRGAGALVCFLGRACTAGAG